MRTLLICKLLFDSGMLGFCLLEVTKGVHPTGMAVMSGVFLALAVLDVVQFHEVRELI